MWHTYSIKLLNVFGFVFVFVIYMIYNGKSTMMTLNIWTKSLEPD